MLLQQKRCHSRKLESVKVVCDPPKLSRLQNHSKTPHIHTKILVVFTRYEHGKPRLLTTQSAILPLILISNKITMKGLYIYIIH